MKWFYITALAVVAFLVASPLLLLPWSSDEAYAGKIVRYDVYGSPIKSIDPATCGDTTSSSFQAYMYEGLYHYHYLQRPAQKHVIPQLAAEMPDISPDGLTYRVQLKSGVKYHRNACFGRDADGRPSTRTVKAHDFVLAFQRVADYYVNTGLAWAFVTRIKALKAPTQATVVAELEKLATQYPSSSQGRRAAADLKTLRADKDYQGAPDKQGGPKKTQSPA